MSDAPRLSLVVPVRNEGVHLPIMLRIIEAALLIPHEILIVCDSPEDDSIAIVADVQKTYPNIRSVLNQKGRGVANAIRSGIEASRADVVLIIVCDDLALVLAVEDMLHLIDEGCDVVSGTRYAHGGRRLGGSLVGGILSRIANRLFTIGTGSALTDSTTGFKMFRRSAFERMNLRYPSTGWAVAFEMAIRAQVLGMKLGEVPIISIDRIYGGRSTFMVWPWVVAYARLFVRGVRELRRSRSSRSKVVVRIPATTAI
jgi:dolichol-phosphate mannosyltransferase